MINPALLFPIHLSCRRRCADPELNGLEGFKLGVFDQQVEDFFAAKAELEARVPVMKFQHPLVPWETGSSIILEEDTALELGDPRLGSILVVLWGSDARVQDGVITLAGPDVGESGQSKLPLAWLNVVRGEFEDDYDAYTRLREAVYGIRLKGFMMRVMPSRSTVWCRVSGEARARGFSLAHLGQAVIDSLKKVGGAEAVEVLFCTGGRGEVERFKPISESARKVVGAMTKMYVEKNYDCESCEYREVCLEIEGLRRMREALTKGKGA